MVMRIAYETEGRALEGTPIMVASTAGNVEAAYGPTGRNMFTTEELFAPLRATANRCSFVWLPPFMVFDADKLTCQALEGEARRYTDTLSRWSETSGRAKVKAA